jgi:transposase InsO family protein
MVFTMKNTPHPERRTAFQKAVKSLGLAHATIDPGKPWQNGFIERSNRTDNDELFNDTRFSSSEERRYQHRLWEMYYNSKRPHQSLGMKAPMMVYLENYRIHAASRMLI